MSVAEAVLLVVIGVVLGAGLAGAWARSLGRRRDQGVLGALVRQLNRFSATGELGRLGEIGDDEDAAAVAHAVNGLLDRVRTDWDALKHDAALGRSLVNSSPNGVLVVAPDGRISDMNAAFARMIEVRGQPRGRLPIEVIPLAEVQQAVDQTLAGHPPEDVACTSGAYDVLVRPVRTDDGGVMVLLQDVTRFRMAERARTEFVANVSHELRTPIATIMGYAETLADEKDKLDPDVAMMADAIHRNARRLRDLFEDLLELSRIEARRRELPLEKQRLRPILERAVASAADMASQRKQAFSLDCPEGLEALINPEALSTIVGNLATNATNYTPEGGRIQVRAKPVGREILVEVQDDGIGIDRAHHERIFERFYRVDEGRSRRVGGTGLGLAIVKHLALASKCRVGVQSEAGKGTTFTVHVPGAPVGAGA